MDFKKEWITHRLDNDAISFTNEFGQILVDKKFTTSQIRNYFGEVRRIQMKGLSDSLQEFHLLKPKLAYAAKRAKDKSGNRNEETGAEKFKQVMDSAHSAVDCDKENAGNRFKNFCDFLESILAYHKFHGGRDN